MTGALAIKREINHYVIRNILANVGLSTYVLIDTLFIAIAAGSLGLTVLNLALPLYNIFNATGLLLGVGGATYFSLHKVKEPARVQTTYSQLMIFAFGLGVVEIGLIWLFLDPLLHLLGADSQTLGLGRTYVGIMAFSAPLYMCNYITINFVRNDGNPSLTMMATLTETVCVVLIDWFFIFKLGLQMEGAALAVIFSPLCSLLVLSRHAHFKHRQLTWRWVKPQLATLKAAARLGLAPFMNEMSSGVSIYVFNWMLLLLAGNYAVAAYGVVANVAIITLAAANGVALGVQPIASREFGKHAPQNAVTAFWHGLKLTVTLAALLTLGLIVFKAPIVALFNTEHQPQLLHYALTGLPIYFTSAVFAAANILMIIFLTAVNRGQVSFTLSFLRGYVILLPLIVLLAWLGGVNGVFAAMPVNELLITLIGAGMVRNELHRLTA